MDITPLKGNELLDTLKPVWDPWPIGTIVTLKSGSPKLTVRRTNTYTDIVDCIWFDGNTAKYDAYPKDTLKPLTIPTSTKNSR